MGVDQRLLSAVDTTWGAASSVPAACLPAADQFLSLESAAGIALSAAGRRAIHNFRVAWRDQIIDNAFGVAPPVGVKSMIVLLL